MSVYASAADLEGFARAAGVRRGAHYAEDGDGRTARAFGVVSLDTVVVLDRDGRVRRRLTSQSRRELVQAARSAVDQAR